ncbi:MAG: YfiR family protein [Planctomycetota bacterium]|jgi:hypothetical protein
MKRNPRHLLPLLGLLAVVLTAAVADRAEEHEIKAAFLYNFTKFVEWPEGTFADDDAPFVLAVLGDDPFGETLDEMLGGKMVGERELVIRRYPTLDDLQPCQLLFVADDFEDGLQHVLERLGSAGVLTVADFDDSVSRGVVIGFRSISRKVKFDINAIAAEARALKISSKLLTLAVNVIDDDER